MSDDPDLTALKEWASSPLTATHRAAASIADSLLAGQDSHNWEMTQSSKELGSKNINFPEG